MQSNAEKVTCFNFVIGLINYFEITTLLNYHHDQCHQLSELKVAQLFQWLLKM